MNTNQNWAHEIESGAESVVRSLPLHLQKPGFLVELGGNTPIKPVGQPPCTGKDCNCTGFGCPGTIIGHDPLLIVIGLVIGLIIGFLLGSRRNR